jgi:hypothetical protein
MVGVLLAIERLLLALRLWHIAGDDQCLTDRHRPHQPLEILAELRIRCTNSVGVSAR